MNDLSRKHTLSLYRISDLNDIVRFDAISWQLENCDKNHQEALLRRLPELEAKPQSAGHPDPDLAFEQYRDTLTDEVRNIAEERGLSDSQIDELLDKSTFEQEDYVREYNEANNYWK